MLPKLIRTLLVLFLPACLLGGLGYYLAHYTPVPDGVAFVASAVAITVYWTAWIIISLFSFASRYEEY